VRVERSHLLRHALSCDREPAGGRQIPHAGSLGPGELGAEGDLVGLWAVYLYADEATGEVRRRASRRQRTNTASDSQTVSNEQVKKLTLEAIRYALDHGWLVRVEMTELGYMRWEATSDEVVADISARWESWGTRPPRLVDMIWFADPSTLTALEAFYPFS
jgi:hypothetical protein